MNKDNQKHYFPRKRETKIEHDRELTVTMAVRARKWESRTVPILPNGKKQSIFPEIMEQIKMVKQCVLFFLFVSVYQKIKKKKRLRKLKNSRPFKRSCMAERLR